MSTTTESQQTESYQYDNPDTAEILNHIKPAREYEGVFETLTGCKFDSMRKEWVKIPYTHPLVSTEEGLAWVMRIIRTHANASATYNDFSEKRIHLKMTAFRNHFLLPTLLSEEALNKYGINSVNIYEVDYQLSNLVFNLINRSLDAGERNSLTQSLRAVENVTNEQTHSGGIFHKIFGKK